MQIIQQSRVVEGVHYERYFSYAGHEGWGFGFPCDANGRLAPFETDAAEENYRKCIENTHDKAVEDRGVVAHPYRYREPAVGRCVCGSTVSLGHFTNPCECGRDYNSAGQLLAPRSQWGEETGESVSDILMADSDPFGGDY